MKEILKITICSSLLLILSLSIFSQTQGKAKLRGIVLDEETGKPLPGVVVRLYSERAGAFHTPAPKTNKKGEWKAYYIRTGKWSIEFQKDGYETERVSYHLKASIGKRVSTLKTMLRPISETNLTENIVDEIKKGIELFNKKNYEEAIQNYNKILEENPNVASIYKHIGDCYFAMEDYEKALQNYTKVHEEHPDSIDVITKIAKTYNNWGKMEKALQWYKKIPIDQIRNADTAYNSGVLIYNSGEPENALPYLERAVEIDPKFADAYYQIGLICTALNEKDKAVEALKKFIELAPESPNSKNAQAIIDALSKTNKNPYQNP